jgi:hypothetical protein
LLKPETYTVAHFLEKWRSLNSSREIVWPFSMEAQNELLTLFKTALTVFNCSGFSGYIKMGSI